MAQDIFSEDEVLGKAYDAKLMKRLLRFIEKGEIPLKKIPLKKKKEPKTDTKNTSFELFKSGKSVTEIAKERALSQNTIESHLAHYVGLGQLDVAQFLNKEKLEKITAYFKTADNKSFGEAKTFVGDYVSYGQIRMALSYLESLKNAEV